jgi:hypothetical protein
LFDQQQLFRAFFSANELLVDRISTAKVATKKKKKTKKIRSLSSGNEKLKGYAPVHPTEWVLEMRDHRELHRLLKLPETETESEQGTIHTINIRAPKCPIVTTLETVETSGKLEQAPN